MDSKKVRMGMKVVIKANPKGQVYVIEKWIDPWTVKLSYSEKGRELNGGEIDITLLEEKK